MDTTESKAPIDPNDESAERDAAQPPGTPTDPAAVVQQLVDPDAAKDLDPEIDPRTGTQR